MNAVGNVKVNPLAAAHKFKFRSSVENISFKSSGGDYEQAENYFRDLLTTFPDYYRAVASLGKTRAAQNDSAGAIEFYEQAARFLPDPQLVAAFGDS